MAYNFGDFEMIGDSGIYILVADAVGFGEGGFGSGLFGGARTTAVLNVTTVWTPIETP